MVDSWLWYFLFLGALVGERLVELAISRRNARWSLDRGAVEYGAPHFRLMKALHTGFFVACGAEVLLLARTFSPQVGWVMVAIALLSQGIRYWVIGTLGRQWNVRVLVIPGATRVSHGPYRFMRHPNYFAVILEGFAVPLIHGAWITAVVFTVLNAWLLSVRIRVEETAMKERMVGESPANGSSSEN